MFKNGKEINNNENFITEWLKSIKNKDKEVFKN